MQLNHQPIYYVIETFKAQIVGQSLVQLRKIIKTDLCLFQPSLYLGRLPKIFLQNIANIIEQFPLPVPHPTA